MERCAHLLSDTDCYTFLAKVKLIWQTNFKGMHVSELSQPVTAQRAAEIQLNTLASWGKRRHMAEQNLASSSSEESLSKFKPTATCRRSAPPAHCGCRPVLVSPHLVTHQCAAAEPPAVGIVKAVCQSISSQFPHLWYTCTERSVITNIPELSK